jgi:hypothetical protein
MEEEVKTLRTIKEFVTWYESREEMPTDKLHEFYIKFKVHSRTRELRSKRSYEKIFRINLWKTQKH